MRRHRSVILLVGVLSAFLVVWNVKGVGQTRLPAASLPPIDRGLVARTYRSPDSPETRLRAAIRNLNGPAQRIGAGGAEARRRPADREVPRRHVVRRARLGPGGARRPREQRAVLRQLRHRVDGSLGGRRGRRTRARGPPRRRVPRSRPTGCTPSSSRTTRSTRSSGTCRTSTWSAPGTSSRRPGRRSPSPCSTRASPSPTSPAPTTRMPSGSTPTATWSSAARLACCIRRSAT